MEFLEKDLEQIIWETDKEALLDKGLYVNGKLFRQLKIGRYGIADLVSFERKNFCIHFTVYELKKDNIGIAAFMQAYSYVKGLVEYLEMRGFLSTFEVVLIGKKLDMSGSFCYLTDLIPQLSFYTYHIDINGLQFTQKSDYRLTKGFTQIIK